MLTWSAILGGAYELSAYAIALTRGGPPERFVATALLGEYAIMPFVQDQAHLHGFQWGIFGGDVVVLFVVLYAAFRWNRRWLLFGSAFQILTVLAHVAALEDPDYDAWSAVTAVILLGLGLITSLLVGALSAKRRNHAVRIGASGAI